MLLLLLLLLLLLRQWPLLLLRSLLQCNLQQSIFFLHRLLHLFGCLMWMQ